MAIGEKQRPEAVVSVTAEDPEPPKKKKDKAEENLAQARKELKENTELVRDLVSLRPCDFTREATWRRRGLLPYSLVFILCRARRMRLSRQSSTCSSSD